MKKTKKQVLKNLIFGTCLIGAGLSAGIVIGDHRLADKAIKSVEEGSKRVFRSSAKYRGASFIYEITAECIGD